MKKLYVLLAAMLIVSVSFAQISTTKKVVRQDGTTITIKGVPAKANAQKTATNSAWFNLIEDAYTYYGTTTEGAGFAPPIQCDTLGLFPYTDGSAHVQFCSFGQMFNWEHECWDYMYNYSGAPENIPYMASAASYSIDSLQLVYKYKRGTNVAANVVDTLAISYIMDIDPSECVYQLGNGQTNLLVMPFLPFDNTTYMASTTSMNPSLSFSQTLTTANIIYDKILLDTDYDSSDDDYFYYLTIPAPADLNNLSCKNFAIVLTFIPGCDRNVNSVIGTDLSTFRTVLYDDPRDGYGELGTPEVLSDYQVGLFHDADNFIDGSLWYNIYQPFAVYDGNPKPSISLLVTCNDCEVVNVPEIEKNNVTIYPNPATNNFTVNLGNDEKANIQLFNIVGQQVYSETITGTAQVNVANLHSGVYMLKINQNGKAYTTKVVVK